MHKVEYLSWEESEAEVADVRVHTALTADAWWRDWARARTKQDWMQLLLPSVDCLRTNNTQHEELYNTAVNYGILTVQLQVATGGLA